MKLFTVYDPITGTILRSGFVLLNSDATLQAQAGESALLDVRGDTSTERVDLTQDPPEVVAK